MKTNPSTWAGPASSAVKDFVCLTRLGAVAMVAACLGSATPAVAGIVIRPVDVQSTTTFTHQNAYSAASLWNASEFSGEDAALIETNSDVPANWPTGTEARPSGYWASGFAGFGNDAGAWPQIIIDLGAAYDVSAIVLWNGATAEGYWTGFKNVDIYKKEAYDLTVPASGAQAVVFSAVPNPNVANAPQVIPVNFLNTRYVLLDCKDSIANWFAGQVEGREIRFVGLTAGEPFPPAIQTHPVNQMVAVGSTVLLTAAAVGGPPLAYRWQRETGGVFTSVSDGGNLAGTTTGSLTLTNVSLADAGNYRVAVSNFDGTANSDVAALTVIDQPVPEINMHAGIMVNGTVGMHYRVEYSDALDVWQLLEDVPSLPSSTHRVYDPTPATLPRRFYRAVIVPTP